MPSVLLVRERLAVTCPLRSPARQSETDPLIPSSRMGTTQLTFVPVYPYPYDVGTSPPARQRLYPYDGVRVGVRSA